MIKKTKQSAVLIGHFVIDNVLLPLVLYKLGKNLYAVWFEDDKKNN